MQRMAEQANEITSTRRYARLLVVAVEGNIGSGKSTFLTHCASDPDVSVSYEPVEQWTNVSGGNLLGDFYRDPTHYGFTFQMSVNLTILHQYRFMIFKNIRFIERSLLNARHCFRRCMVANGTLEPVMATVLDQWHDSVIEVYGSRPHAIEEGNITLQYIQQLHLVHEEWLEREHHQNVTNLQDMPIFIINVYMPLERLMLMQSKAGNLFQRFFIIKKSNSLQL